MKFDRLRLHGFKSFVDSTDLHIEPGLTGIVGPNGCGKSNLLEALRWVMGETSPKSMRGSGMEDVIFAGTAGRPSRNNAEVSLWLDNKGRLAPSEYNEQDQLEITRRIERDAGSAYKINQKDVRQRDVQLLFADLSTGAHSPALVKQGQIGQLINAKPTARRAILEEAAGISGLHSRRHEAELKLRAAETNLTRLDDVLQQIEGQLASLKRQARQATRYRNLSGHIRRSEAMVLHLRWTDACEGLETAQNRLQEAEEAVAELTELAVKASTAQIEAQEVLPPLREEEAKRAAALHRLTVERENLDAEEQRALAEAERLQARLTQIASDIERDRALGADADAVIERLTAESDEINSLRATQNEAAEIAKTKVDETGEALRLKEDDLDQLTAEAARLAAQRNTLERSISDLKIREEKLVRRLEQVNSEIEGLQPSPEDAQRISEARAAVEAAQGDAETAEKLLVEAEAARGRLQNAKAMARAPMEDAERTLAGLKTEAKTLARVLQVEEQGLWPPMIDAIKVEAGYEKALGAALGDDLDIPTDTSAPIHWDTLPPLENARSLPAGATPLAQYVQGPDALTRRLSQIGVVTRDQGEALQRHLTAGQRLVTADGDLWRWDGLTATAEAPTAAATRLAQRNRLEELDAEIEAAETAARTARETFTSARQEAETANEQEAVKRRVLRDAEQKHARARDQLVRAEREAERNASRLSALADSVGELEADISDIRQRSDESQASLNELAESTTFQTRISELRETVSQLRQEFSEDKAAFEGIERDREARERRLVEIERERSDWLNRQESAHKHIETLDARALEISGELEQVKHVPAEIETRRTALLDKISDAETARNEAADLLAKAEEAQRACDKEAKSLNEALSEMREKRARGEALVEGATERQNELTSRIHEALQCLPEDVVYVAEIKDGQELPTLEKAEHKLDRLKRERENLGGVNLRAEEEAQEYQDRLDSMIAEREDLEGAIARLRTGIANLNREGRERLLTAFETVNEHFQSLFKSLFVGGEAHLSLVESDDPLEAGLEIFARPPGKKLQTMSLLSGGEQALTALALIFAVFLSNPAPICVLDEVDAPLDDANVERFCNLLDEMTKQTDTRFLVITHHALSMSRMDRLYGVTMMERGVSHLVSVDLSGAEKVLAAE